MNKATIIIINYYIIIIIITPSLSFWGAGECPVLWAFRGVPLGGVCARAEISPLPGHCVLPLGFGSEGPARGWLPGPLSPWPSPRLLGRLALSLPSPAVRDNIINKEFFINLDVLDC